MGAGKPRGLKAGRKLKNTHRVMRWAQKSYRKSNLGTYLKCSPFEGSSHAKGIVLEKMYGLPIGVRALDSCSIHGTSQSMGFPSALATRVLASLFICIWSLRTC